MSGTHHLYQPYNAPFQTSLQVLQLKATPTTKRTNCGAVDLVELCVLSLSFIDALDWRTEKQQLDCVVSGRKVQFEESSDVTQHSSAPYMYSSVFY